jgi:hypothetical protein
MARRHEKEFVMTLELGMDLSPEARAEAAHVAELETLEKELSGFVPNGRASFRRLAVRMHTEPAARLFETDTEVMNQTMFKLQVIIPAVLRNNLEKIELMSGAIDKQFTEMEERLQGNLGRARQAAQAQGVIALDGEVNVSPVSVRSYSQGFARWVEMVQTMDQICLLVDAMWHHSRIDTQARHREQNEVRNILTRFKRKLIVEALAGMRFAAGQKRERTTSRQDASATGNKRIDAPSVGAGVGDGEPGQDANYATRVQLAAQGAGMKPKRPARSKKYKQAPVVERTTADDVADSAALVPVEPETAAA